MVTDGEKGALTDYLEGLVGQLPRRPRAMVVVSAHWEEAVPTVMSSPRPPMLYDYYNFPPETYQIQWPAPGEPQLAARVRALVEGAGVPDRGGRRARLRPRHVRAAEADVPRRGHADRPAVAGGGARSGASTSRSAARSRRCATRASAGRQRHELPQPARLLRADAARRARGQVGAVRRVAARRRSRRSRRRATPRSRAGRRRRTRASRTRARSTCCR